MGAGYKWSQEEEAHLEDLVGLHPFPELVAIHQAKGEERGWPWRSPDAISVRIGRKIGSRKPLDDNFTVTTLAKILGYRPDRVRGWGRQKLLRIEKVGGQTKISKARLFRFIRKYPRLFIEANDQGLEYLFGAELSQWVKSHESAIRKPMRVRNLKTGKIYNSLNLAEKDCYLSRDIIKSRAEKRNGFEFVA